MSRSIAERWRAATALGLVSLVSTAAAADPPPVPTTFAAQLAFLDTGHERVAYLRRGAGPPLVLLHGGGTWSYTWRHNFGELARSHDVVAFDMIGHGFTTSGGEHAYTLAETSAVIGRVLDRLHIAHASFVGNSWGGGWALAFAQAHPERVDRLVLIGSSGLPGRDRLEWELMKWPVIGEAMIRLAGRDDIASGLKTAVADPSSVTSGDIDAVWAPMRRSDVRAAQVGFMRHLDWRETAARLPVTKTPVLLIWGDRDRYVHSAQGRKLCAALPDARFVVVADAGHVAHEDQPIRVDALIDDFTLRGLVPSDSVCRR